MYACQIICCPQRNSSNKGWVLYVCVSGSLSWWDNFFSLWARGLKFLDASTHFYKRVGPSVRNAVFSMSRLWEITVGNDLEPNSSKSLPNCPRLSQNVHFRRIVVRADLLEGILHVKIPLIIYSKNGLGCIKLKWYFREAIKVAEEDKAKEGFFTWCIKMS